MPIDIFADSKTERPPIDVFEDEDASKTSGIQSILSDLFKGLGNIPGDVANTVKSVPQGLEDILNMSPSEIGKNLAAGTASLGKDVINLPYSLNQYLRQKKVLPENMKGIPTDLIPHVPDVDFNEKLGIKPSAGSNLLQGLTSAPLYAINPEATFLKRLLSQAGKGAILGSSQNSNPIAGLSEGALLSAVPESPKGTKSAIGKVSSSISPKKYAEKIIDDLGEGKSLEENSRSIADDIKKSFDEKILKGSIPYQKIFSEAGKDSIYGPLNLKMSNAYENLDKSIYKDYDLDLKDLHNKFSESPTLENAHDLQSQLGFAVRKLKKSDARQNLSTSDRITLQKYKRARGALKSDIGNYLSRNKPELNDLYDAANKNWEATVVPYLENSNISKIAKGKVTNPRNINSIFKNPEENVEKIVEDLGGKNKNRILYSELGKMKNKVTPEKLINAIDELDKKGLSSYIDDDLRTQIESLSSKTKRRDFAQKIAAFSGGGLLGHQLGGTLPEIILALSAGSIAPEMLNFMRSKIPKVNISRVTKPASKLTRKSSELLLANALRGDKKYGS